MVLTDPGSSEAWLILPHSRLDVKLIPIRVALPLPVHQVAPTGILIAYQRIYLKMGILIDFLNGVISAAQ
jgi:hypothetical protein